MQDSDEKIDLARRDLLKKTCGVTIAALAPGVFLHTLAANSEDTKAIAGNRRWGLLIDANRCTEGCTACIDACQHENGLDRQVKPTNLTLENWEQQKSVWIRKIKLRDNQTGRITQFPIMCQHCEYPPCVNVCPTGASFKRADGIVIVDRHLCIGCRYCIMACPYKARSFIHQETHDQITATPRGKGCVESCNLCIQRRDENLNTTACADACTTEGHQAIVFGDLQDPESLLRRRLREFPSRQLREDLALNPGVRYSGI